MKYGVNYTGPKQYEFYQDIKKKCDFVELLIDNFLHLDPFVVKDFLKGKPCSFHIMNSHFFYLVKNNSYSSLKKFSDRIKYFIKVLEPFYVSDHLFYPYQKNLILAATNEIDYENDFKDAIRSIQFYQDCLDSRILIENFPSQINIETEQASIYHEFCQKTSCGILFDLSNAIIAQKNIGYKASNWLQNIEFIENLHIAGFRKAFKADQLIIDSHDCPLDPLSLKFTRMFVQQSNSKKRKSLSSIVLERDDNFIKAEYLNDLYEIKSLMTEVRKNDRNFWKRKDQDSSIQIRART